MQPSQFFSHVTAAELLKLRLPEGFRAGELHVSSTPPLRAPRSRGVVGHQLRLLHPLEQAEGGLPVSDPVDTWLSLGATLSADELTIMGDGLVRRVRPSADMAALRAALAQTVGRRGHQKLMAAFNQMRSDTDSARETMLRLLITRAGFPEPEVNGVILNSFGAAIAHGDLVYRDHRVILEYDGGQHREDERQFNVDIDRLDQIMEEGWRVIRINKSLMSRRATLLGKVETALLRGGWSRPPR